MGIKFSEWRLGRKDGYLVCYTVADIPLDESEKTLFDVFRFTDIYEAKERQRELNSICQEGEFSKWV